MRIIDLNKTEKKEVSHNPAIKKQEMLTYNQIPNLAMFSQVTFEPGQVAPSHSHKDMYETFFVREGKGLMIVDGKEIDLVKDMCVSVDLKEMHEIIYTSNEDLVLVYFGIIKSFMIPSSLNE